MATARKTKGKCNNPGILTGEVGKAHRFEKGNKAAVGKGRPKLLKTLIKDIPPDAQEKLAGILYNAISMPSLAAASKYLEEELAKGQMEFGLVLELALKSLNGRDGWDVFLDIYTRIFGSPRQSTETKVSGSVEYLLKDGDE